MPDDLPFARLPVRRVEASPHDGPPPAGQWPATIPAVTQLLSEGLDLGPATVLVGENGTGKSTLVGAIAMTFGLNAEGGSTGAMHRTFTSESGLHQHLRCRRGPGAPRWGFFLRAETMHSFFTYLETDGFGERLHERSHGESFLALLDSPRYLRQGFYVFDEPESALSFTAQLRLLAQLLDLVRGGSQVLLSTHSPVLASLPGARVLELGDWGRRESAWDDLDLVAHYRSFLTAPERYLRYLR